MDSFSTMQMLLLFMVPGRMSMESMVRPRLVYPELKSEANEAKSGSPLVFRS